MTALVAAGSVTMVVAGVGCSSNSPGMGSGLGGSTGHAGTGGRQAVGAGGAAGSSPAGTGGGAVGGAGVGGTGGPSVSGGAGGEALGGAAGMPAGTGGAATAGAGGNPGVGGATGGAGGAGGTGQTGCSIPSGPAGSWVEIPAPSGLGNFVPTDAFAVGLNDLLFAGSTVDPTGLTPPTNAQVLRWTQGCWAVELMFPPASPQSTGGAVPASVHGTGPDDLWATYTELLYHRDAQGWTPFADQSWQNMVRQPPSYIGPIEFNRVREAAVNDFWIAATSNILHWSGESWTTYNFDDAGYPNASASVGYSFTKIWVDSPSSVWITGPSDQIGNTMSLGIIHHFDGANWTHTGAGVDDIFDLWRDGSLLWMAQPAIEDVSGTFETLALFSFDGTKPQWVQIAGVDAATNSIIMTSLFGHGTNDTWAAGQDVAHFDGQGWSLATNAPAAARSTLDISNTFVAGDAGSVWLVTPGPRFFRMVTSP